MSGHSKWAQIKHKKAITDAKKGQLFSKLVREITVAAKTGGAAPDTNTRLRSALLRAKMEGLPKENIDRALARASGAGEGTELVEFVYEATSAHGVMILVEGITDNKNRTTAEIKHLLAEHNAKFAEPGSVMWNFDKIGTIEISKSKNSGKSNEEIEEAVINSGASDLQTIEDVVIIETEFKSREEVRKKLEQADIAIGEVSHDYKPKSITELSPEENNSIEPLFEELLSQDDVQEIYTNIN